MGCKCNSVCRSCQTAYNNTAQAMTGAAAPVSILGNFVTDTGKAISTQTGGFSVESSGLYHVSFDITFTASAAGTETMQIYDNGVALPCAVSQYTAAAAEVLTGHVETRIALAACCGNTHDITCQLSGVAGSVNHVCASAVKEG